VTKLHATISEIQIGHRTFGFHVILVFFALLDLTITKFIRCVNLRHSSL